VKERLPTAVAVTFGAVVLFGYFLELPLLRELRAYLVETAATLAAIALLVGVINLLRVHAGKVLDLKSGWPYSLALLLGLGGVLLIWASSYFIPSARQYIQFVLLYVQTPLETALGALLAFVLVAAGMRLARKGFAVNTVIFLVVTLILLLGLISFVGISDALIIPRNWILQVPAVAGARGIVLGLALGAVATGLRVLLGADRPYGE